MITQRLLNAFPLWSKARTDPSSFSARLFSTWGEYFDWAYADIRRRKEDASLYKHGLGVGDVHVLSLLEEDFMTYTLSVGGVKSWTYPVLTGDGLSLERVTSLEDLLYGVPTRLTAFRTTGVDAFVIYTDDRENAVSVLPIDVPERIMFEVSGSTDYYKKTRTRNNRASGKHQLIVVGHDHNDIRTKEILDFTFDGYYQTKNVFKDLVSVIPEGFDGEITGRIFWQQSLLKDHYRVAVSDEQEGPQYLELRSAAGKVELAYSTYTVLSGEEFLDGTPEIPDNNVEFWTQYLLNSEEAHYTAVDACLCPNTTRLWVLDTTGVVHVYEHKVNTFVTPLEQSALTYDSYLEIIPVKHYSSLDEQVTLFTRWAKTSVPLVYVSIWRIDPAGVKTHLQVDKTWGPTAWRFYVQNVGTFIEESWKDFSFTSTQDQLGQWEFYVEAATKADTSISWTGVMVDSLIALVDFPTSIVSPQAINFTKENYLCISSSADFDGKPNSIYEYKVQADGYLCDPTNQVIYLKESYASVDVTYE